MPAHARTQDIAPLEHPTAEKAGTISVFIFSDHPVFRSSLSWKLDESCGIEVIGESGSPHEAIAAALAYRPDAVIADMRIGDGDAEGIEAVKSLVDSLDGIPVIVYSDHYSSSYRSRMEEAGASAFVMKSPDATRLAKAIHEAVASSAPVAGVMPDAA